LRGVVLITISFIPALYERKDELLNVEGHVVQARLTAFIIRLAIGDASGHFGAYFICEARGVRFCTFIF